MSNRFTRSGNGSRGKHGARFRRALERASRNGWVLRRTKNMVRFRRRESGWLDFDMKSNLNLFATGAVLIHKGRKP